MKKKHHGEEKMHPMLHGHLESHKHGAKVGHMKMTEKGGKGLVEPEGKMVAAKKIGKKLKARMAKHHK